MNDGRDLIGCENTADTRTRHEGPDFPLTSLQQGMLVQELAGGEPGNNVLQVVCDFAEPVDPARIEHCFQILAQRHDALGLAFSWHSEGYPRQSFHGSPTIPVAREDWRHAEVHAVELLTREFLHRDRLRGFDVSVAPLCRGMVIQLPKERTRVVWTIHHLIADGAAIQVLLDDLSRILDAPQSSHPRGESTVGSYREFLAWWSRRDFEESRSFWSSLLQPFHSTTAIPGDRMCLHRDERHGRDVERESVRNESHPFRLSETVTAELYSLAERLGITLNTIVQWAWELLLSRHSRESDVFFGITRACRYACSKDAAVTAGLFTNVLPLHISIDPNETVEDALRRLRRVYVATGEHKHTPLVQISRYANCSPHAPLFETLLAFESRTLQAAMELRDPAWQKRDVRLEQQTSLPMTLAVFGGSEITGRFIVDATRINPVVAAQLCDQFVTIMGGVASLRKQQLTWEIPWLPEDQRRQVVEQFNRTDCEYSQHHCLHQLVEEQVARTPAAIALVSQRCSLSYEVMNAEANRVALKLENLGHSLGEPVGIWCAPSVEGVIAVLAVLKRGSPYVPLPVDAADQRLRALATDAGIEWLLTTKTAGWSESLSPLQSVTIQIAQVPVGDRAERSDNWPATTAAPAASPDDLACIIYTSGTTGTPKGVCLPHRGLVNVLEHRVWRRFKQGDFQIAPLTAPLHFDASIVQLFSPLISGGTLIVCDDLEQLARSHWYHRLTALTGASTLIAMLIRQSGVPRSARVIGLGAEPVSGELLRTLAESPSTERLLTGYGVTECSCYSTDTTIFERAQDGTGGYTWVAVENPVSHIGRPIANTQVYVLDERLEPVPIGVVGELYIGGIGVAKGYLKRPELDRERFLVDHLSGAAQGRLYRTGDRGRWLADGSLEFLGRVDRQLKWRGIRIEPDEIERSACQHPDIAQCAVVVQNQHGSPSALAAFCVPGKGCCVTTENVRAHLTGILPRGVIPTVIVLLDRLPLTVSGKVDRDALVGFDTSNVRHGDGPREDRTGDAPRSDIERRLLKIWSRLFPDQDVETDDDFFFSLGGDSVTAIECVLAINREFMTAITFSTLLQNPSIAKLAPCLQDAVDSKAPHRTTLGAIDHTVPKHVRMVRPGSGEVTLVSIGIQCSSCQPELAGDVGMASLKIDENLDQGVREFSDAAAIELAREVPSGSIVLIGFSYGGLLAYALAVRLRKQINRPVHLIMLEPSVPLEKKSNGR